ncbi:hypothetical protein [Streptomyces sp. NPDC056194]|uniref:hypothetical protein n=1 Tax=unclassified Streptomyces TaxID=2593676 RepID=UPI0035D6593A
MRTLTVRGTPPGSASTPAGGTHDTRGKASNRALLKLGYIVFRAHGAFSLLDDKRSHYRLTKPPAGSSGW